MLSVIILLGIVTVAVELTLTVISLIERSFEDDYVALLPTDPAKV